MRGVVNTKWQRVMAAMLCCIAWAPSLWAAPPSAKTALGVARSPLVHLDLRPPAVLEAGAFGESNDTTATHARMGGASTSRMSSLSAPVAQGREMSAAEAFARRVHREGLPIARLWESHSALVSLGLNARGKPGLWLVQKTR